MHHGSWSKLPLGVIMSLKCAAVDWWLQSQPGLVSPHLQTLSSCNSFASCVCSSLLLECECIINRLYVCKYRTSVTGTCSLVSVRVSSAWKKHRAKPLGISCRINFALLSAQCT